MKFLFLQRVTNWQDNFKGKNKVTFLGGGIWQWKECLLPVQWSAQEKLAEQVQIFEYTL